MKALALTGFEKPPSVIDVPDPVPGSGEVLVRVGAASVNAYDTFVAMGAMKDYLPYEFPAVLGGDVAGVVESVGEGVEGFAPRARVFGMVGSKTAVHDGSFGELVTANATSLAPTPDGVDDLAAGSLGVAGTTALEAVNAVDPAAGDVVLVVGATGGVGSFAVQLAAARGAHVIASVRPGDEGFVTDLGAAETVDYTTDLEAAILQRYPEGVAAVIDLVHRDAGEFGALTALAREGGRAVSSVGAAGESTRIGEVAVSNANGNPTLLAELGAMVASGTLRAPIRRTYSLDEAAKALQDFTAEHTVGKLVIVAG
ncbi:MAG TPA: NADP-dependent oxidoreductase [Actinomycetota bacterium]|jgi:NADPH:quinone reductase-like Zn-dependent oxidoreductase